MTYRVRFETGGHLLNRRVVDMIYVAQPGSHILLTTTRGDGDTSRYLITAITWTPGRDHPCDYVLSVQRVEDAPDWALAVQ